MPSPPQMPPPPQILLPSDQVGPRAKVLKAMPTAKRMCARVWSRESEDGGVLKVRTGKMLASPVGSGKPVGPAA